MFKSIIAGIGMSGVTVTMLWAQTPGAPAGGAGRGAAEVPYGTPTQDQWNKPDAQAYVAKAKALAGNDADLQYDFTFNCTPDGTHVLGGGGARMTMGDNASMPGSPIPFVEMPEKTTILPPHRMFDNFWRFGSTGVGTWLLATPQGYILYDTMNSSDEARDIILGGMKKVGLDPAKIKYIVLGHGGTDHAGGARYLQETLKVPMYMGRDDWGMYLKGLETRARTPEDKTPMKRPILLEDGMKLTVGDAAVTLIAMPGHTAGSYGMIAPVKYQGRVHNILIVTASAGGMNVPNRESFIGGYEHIWNWAEREKVESVINAHLNYNINTLSRHTYVNDHYPPAKNPLLYGVEKTHKYIEITRACVQARLEALGW